MAFLDTLIVLGLVIFIGLLVWSQVQRQRMYDTLMEIKDIIQGFKT